MQADRCTSNESLAEAIEHMLISKPNKRHEVSNLIDYVFKDRLSDDEIKGLKKIIFSGEVDEIMITVRERLAQNDKRIFNDAITQGIAQGIAQRNKAIVKKMISMGMSKSNIQTATGLSKEEIERISND